MKTSIKTLACATMVSIAFLACDNTSASTSLEEIPAMDSRVVSYKEYVVNDEYITQQLGWYSGYGFTTDEEILKLWFPNIFNDGQAKSGCNYFALYFTGNSSGLSISYEILSQDMVLHRVVCTRSEPQWTTTLDFLRRAMLICDDKDWKLKESIDLDSMRFYDDPNWECESGKGSPNWEEIYF